MILLHISQAGGRDDPLLPFGKFGLSRHQTELSLMLEQLHPAVAVGTLMPGSSCFLTLQQKTNPAEPAMAAYGFPCSLHQVFERSIGCTLSACIERSQSKAKSHPKNAHDTVVQQFLLLSCPGDLAQMLVSMSLHGTPALLTTLFSACKPVPGAPPEGIIQAEVLLHNKCAGFKQPGIATRALGYTLQASPQGACVKILSGFNVLAAYRG